MTTLQGFIAGLAVLVILFVSCSTGNMLASEVSENTVRVGNALELRIAVNRATPGTTILIAPGTYSGGLAFTGVRGAEGAPIAIASEDPSNPAVFVGGSTGLHFVNPAFLELRDLVVRGAMVNGINIDDGGSYAFTAHDIILRGITVTDVNPSGNHDGIKLSGLIRVKVEDCFVEGWGGSAIDMVGVHDAVISGCVFRNQDDVGTGVQAKGGTANVIIRNNRFEHAGHRAVNIGGSTGLEFFRPPLARTELPFAEARDIFIRENVFIGSFAPVAFVGVDGSEVSFNTIYRPKRWVVRILQETTSEGFVASRHGTFTDNVVVWYTSELSQTVNIGPNTAPETFEFARNWWYAEDEPGDSTPGLPVEESGGVIGVNPEFVDAEAGDLRLGPDSPVRKEDGEPRAGAPL